MHDAVSNFINLDTITILYLFGVGFVGGLVSGFIGSGGAFVLTPGMMSLGVPGLMAVASNMCHKFPKALVGALKRAKYGQVDVKLGLVLYDAWKTYKAGNSQTEEKTGKLAKWVQSINIPGTMVYFKSINARVSILFTIPLGFATGMLAATIAVGGFIGVPAMIYVLGAPSLMASATELVIAFVMGLGGSLIYAMHGMVDIRLAMIILAGSLFGIQLGAIGTTYVKPYMVKVVMGTIMIIVLVSRAIVIPVYLSELDLIAPIAPGTARLLKTVSFYVMVLALVTGAFIILRALIGGMRAHRLELAAAIAPAFAPAAAPAI